MLAPGGKAAAVFRAARARTPGKSACGTSCRAANLMRIAAMSGTRCVADGSATDRAPAPWSGRDGEVPASVATSQVGNGAVNGVKVSAMITRAVARASTRAEKQEERQRAGRKPSWNEGFESIGETLT